MSQISDSPGAPTNPAIDPSKGTADGKLPPKFQEKKDLPQGQGVKKAVVEKVPMLDKNAIALFVSTVITSISKVY